MLFTAVDCRLLFARIRVGVIGEGETVSELPEAKTELEIRAKRLMTGEGFRHWMQCRSYGTCPACNLPLPLPVEGEPVKIRRGVHKSCHELTYRYARRGDWTIDDRIREGKIDPGRPPHPLTEEARQESDG